KGDARPGLPSLGGPPSCNQQDARAGATPLPPAAARFGNLDLRSQAKFASALKSDTPRSMLLDARSRSPLASEGNGRAGDSSYRPAAIIPLRRGAASSCLTLLSPGGRAMLRRTGLPALALLLFGAAPAPAQQGVLDLIPANASAALAVRNLDELTTKGEKLVADARLQLQELPRPSQLLAELYNFLGGPGSIDPKGSGAILLARP